MISRSWKWFSSWKYDDYYISVHLSRRWPPWPLIDWDIYFRLLWNRWQEFNETWQEARSQCHLPSLCFSGRSETKMAALASDWLIHFRRLLWNRWMEFNETWQETGSQRALPSLWFLVNPKKKQDGSLGLWLAKTLLTSSLKPLNGIQRNLTGSKISIPPTSLCFTGRSE